MAKYPIESWPTLMVIDPARQEAVLRWPGSLNVSQLVKLLDDGERAARSGGTGALEALARADRLNAVGNKQEAAALYRTALPTLPADKRPRAIESLLGALALGHDALGCARAAVELVPSLVRGPSFANAASVGIGCAAELKGDERTGALAVLEPLGYEAVALPRLLADDRSGIFEELVELRDQAGDAAGKKALAARWLAFLEGEAAHATSVEQRAAFDPHRVNAALALGEPLRAEAALQASERDLPHDYNPPARLALIYHAAKRTPEAMAAIDRALGKVYGPRALRLYDLKVVLQLESGDKVGAKKTLTAALAAARALPPGARRDQAVAAFDKQLQAL